jgi:hypothetical protein
MRKYALVPILTCCILATVVGCATQSTQPVAPNLTRSSVPTRSGGATANVAITNHENVSGLASTSSSQSRLASMSPEQLIHSAEKNGTPMPFASRDITRRVLPPELTVDSPNSRSAFPNSFGNGNFFVVDQWSGTIQGKAFKIEVEMKPDGKQYIIGMTSGTTTAAVRLARQPWITNFTGGYVVFATPNPSPGNQMLAINLTTGNTLKDSREVRQMSGITGNAGYPTHIGGLNKPYNVFPHGGNSY